MMADVAATATDARIVFVNQGEGDEVIEQFLTEEGLDLDHVVVDALGEFGQHYNARGLPTTLFIGRDGRLPEGETQRVSGPPGA